ncbi:MAG: ketopantoate reductase C-terminal domain-containing protein [Bdellovibrionota bacterium]
MTKSTCIVGGGAIGIALATLLSQQQKVYLLVKPQSKISFQSLTPEVTGAIKLHASENLSILEASDLAKINQNLDFWICTRAFDASSAVSELKPYLSKSVGLSIMSNGLGVYQEVLDTIGTQHPVARVLLSFGSLKEDKLQVRIAGALKASLSSSKKDLTYLDQVKGILIELGFDINYEESVLHAEWKKAVTNVIINSICTIANTHNGSLQTNPVLKEQALNMLSEIKLLARSQDVDLSNLTEQIFLDSISTHATNFNSTLVALKNGQRTESEYMIYKIVEIARRLKIKIPVINSVADELRTIELQKVNQVAN